MLNISICPDLIQMIMVFALRHRDQLVANWLGRRAHAEVSSGAVVCHNNVQIRLSRFRVSSAQSFRSM